MANKKNKIEPISVIDHLISLRNNAQSNYLMNKIEYMSLKARTLTITTKEDNENMAKTISAKKQAVEAWETTLRTIDSLIKEETEKNQKVN